MTLPGSPLRKVTHYIWISEGRMIEEADALAYWPLSPGTDVIEGRRYVSIGPDYQDYAVSPTHERLECGHEQEIRLWNGRRWFNRRRRCMACGSSA